MTLLLIKNTLKYYSILSSLTNDLIFVKKTNDLRFVKKTNDLIKVIKIGPDQSVEPVEPETEHISGSVSA
jgi:Txe/YoeB family toxin of Txe-Axe toxin-antitoxin module